MKKRAAPSLLNTIAMFIPLALVAAVFIFSNHSSPPQHLTANTIDELNCTAVHWHTLLKIRLNDEVQLIPADVGITVGKVIDTELSGANASPMHTHDVSGIIHIENNCPAKKPEAMELDYFFTVWEQEFNLTCIMDNCNKNGKVVQIKVNGIDNHEFELFKPQDGDEIVISYGRPTEGSGSKATLADLPALQVE